MSEPLFSLIETNGHWSIQPASFQEQRQEFQQFNFDRVKLELKDQPQDKPNWFIRFLQRFRKICK